MSLNITSIESWFSTTEAEVVAIVTNIKTELQVVEADLDTAAKWLAQQVPAITGTLTTVIGLAGAVGLAANPSVATAITAANVAVTALNAFATAENSGSSDAAAVVNGYVAVKQAQAAVATAASVAAATPAAPAAVAAAQASAVTPSAANPTAPASSA